MNCGIRQIMKRVISACLVVAMFAEVAPLALAVELLERDKPNGAARRATASNTMSESIVRSDAELASAYDIQKDSQGKFQSITYSAGEQPSQQEILSLLDVAPKRYESKEVAEQAITSELKNSLGEKYQLSESEFQTAVELHSDAIAFKNELEQLEITKKQFDVSNDTASNIKKLIVNGFTNSEATAALISSKILGVDLSDIIAAKQTELQTEVSAEQDEDLAEEKSSEAKLAKRLGVPESVLEKYASSHSIDQEKIMDQYAATLKTMFPVKQTGTSSQADGKATTEDSYAPEEIIGQPFTYDSNGDVDVSLNSGEYTYTETDLSLPGVNGMDINLQRQFSSAMATTGTPYGKFDFDYDNGSNFILHYKAYEWVNIGEAEPTELREIHPALDYDFINPGLNLNETLYGLGEYNEALFDLMSRENATLVAVDPAGEEVTITLCPSLEGISPYFENACENKVRNYSYTLDSFGLGEGWRFNLPTIERYRAKNFSGDYDVIGDDLNYEYRLVLPDGRRYHIDFEGDTYSNLTDYTLEDMKLYDSGRGYAGARYTLEYHNGTKVYFDSSRQVIAMVDAYDNTIKVEYSNDDDTEFTIIDTMGNVIKYTNVSPSTETYYAGHSGDEEWLYDVAYELTLNGDVVREYYSYDNPTDDVQYLMFVVDECGEAVQYRSTVNDYEFNAFVRNNNDYINTESIPWVRLREVTNPDGSVRNFGMGSGEKVIGVCGSQEYPLVRYYQTETTPESSVGEKVVSVKDYEIGDFSNLLRNSSGTYTTQVAELYWQEIDGKEYEFDKTLTYYHFNTNHDMAVETLFVYDPLQYDTLSTISKAEDWIDESVKYSKQYTMCQYNSDHLLTDKTIQQHRGDNTPDFSTRNYSYDYNEYGQVVSQTNPNGQLTEYTYDDRYGQPTRIEYEQDTNTDVVIRNTLVDDGRKIGTTTSTMDGVLQAKKGYEYDAYGNVIREKNYESETDYNETQYTYYKNAWLAETKAVNVTDADGQLVAGTPGYSAGTVATTNTYNDRGWVTSTTDGNGNTTSMTYDGIGRVTSVTKPEGSKVSYEYNTADCEILVTDELGTVTKNTYDPYGNLIGVYDVTNSTQLASNIYWAGQLAESTIYSSQGEDQTQYHYYDVLGREIETGYLDGNSELYCETTEYNDVDWSATKLIKGDQTAATQKTVSYFDEMGQLVESCRYFEDDSETNLYEYDYVGNCVEQDLDYAESGGISGRTTYTYDVFGNVLTIKDALDNLTAYEYDLSGNKTEATDAKGNTTTFAYDALSRLIKTEQPFDANNTAVSTYLYDGAGNVLKQENSSNIPGEAAETRVTEYEYDDQNRVVLAARFAPEPNFTQYAYDEAGNMLRVYTGLHAELDLSGSTESGADEEYAVTEYTYDNRSRMTRMKDALGQSEQYVYDKNGQVVSKTDRNGNTTSYSYNGMGKPVHTEVKNSSGTITDTMDYTYASNGALHSQSNGDHTTRYYYDAFGRVIEESTDEQTIYNEFDSMGNREEINLFHGVTKISSIDYDYNANGQMTRASGNGITAEYAYDANGNRESTTYGNGNTTTYTYNAANLPVSVVNKNGTSVISSFAYDYALDGNVVSKTDHTGKVTEYSYDGMNRLTEEVQTENGTLVQSYAYTFDDGGNRETLTAAGADAYTVAYSYDANNRLLENVKTTDAQTEKTLYFYDPNGNQIGRSMETQRISSDGEALSATDTVESYEKNWYNGFNQMVGMKNDQTEAAYSYAPSGLRVSKTIGEQTTDYVLDGDYVAAELNGDTVTALYTHGNGLAGSVIGDKTSYYLYNAHGDVVNLTDPTGTVTQTYEYDAFGNEVDPAENDVNPFRYCGEYFDAETGNIYLRARYYDMSAGCFLAEDTFRGSSNSPLTFNLYIYCGNNPVMYYDPDGHSWQEVKNRFRAAYDNASARTEEALDAADRYFSSELGVDTAAVGAFFLMMEYDGRGGYHARTDAWQQHAGYNDLYDKAFDFGTGMSRDKYDFSYGGKNYRFWVWKGDYINLGAGAELGIYEQMTVAGFNTPHWEVNHANAMKMSMSLSYQGKVLGSYNPSQPQWWITSFYPGQKDARASDLRASFTVDFSKHTEMFKAFRSLWDVDGSSWVFDPKNYTATLTY